MAIKNENAVESGQTAAPLSLSRRDFLKRLGILGGGIVIYFSLGDTELPAQARREGFLGANIPADFNAFLRIGTDERVTCLTGKIEMGQGPITSLPQMLAEELDVSYDSVDIIMGDTDLCPWDAGTFGSLSTRHFGWFLREAASEAKGVLKELAADYLMCPLDRLATEKGVVFDRDQPLNRVTYGRLTKGKIIERHLKQVPPLKPVAEHTVMGKSFLRRDAYEKVTGKAQYAGDLRLPGMLHAKILRPPAHGAGLQSADLSAAELVEGVKVIRQGELIAVLHEFPDVAQQALEAIKAQFSRSESELDDKNIFDHFLKSPPQPQIASRSGSLPTGEGLAEVILEETYLNSYVAHAPMETHTATARFENDRVTVWASTQTPFPVQRLVAETLGLKADKVRLITPFVGGGFGGKTNGPQAAEAAILAKLSGRPVQVAYSRAEEFFYDMFRPAAVVKIKSGLNKAGEVVLWDYKVYQAGQRGAEVFYAIPHHQAAVYGGWQGSRQDHPFAVGPWRAPSNNTNTYARELHFNLMAARACLDPLEFRLKHLQDKRMIGVLKAAAQKFGWTSSKTPSGRGYGLACGLDAGTYVAAMAEVAVDPGSGAVKVKRVTCAQDMGLVVNPEGAQIQMEGCIIMGLGYALSEEVRFKNGRIFDLNFDSYNLPLFSWLPEIETVLVENKELPPQGGGEPAIINMGGVIATAIHDATGAKLLQLPMTPERVKAAMKQT
ncbi:MAG: molybdopterin cofactor-binding domain-containing protein [Pseudomonadota bacterium]